MRHFFDHPRAVNLSDHSFLYRCIELAQKARRDVYPNPYVGAVVVHNGKIIGEGFHPYSGGPHAEVQAIAAVKDKSLLPQSTIYVSLEPCSHFGKTPPCSDLILHHRIPRVVIGVQDPNPRVDGGGIERLKAQGVKVEVAPNSHLFVQLNKVFWVNQLKKRTYVCLKWAETSDGFLAGTDDQQQPFPVGITGPAQNKLVHSLRAYHHGIMVGRRTAEIDNPSLTTRHFPGRSPIRLVFDSKLQLSSDLHLLSDGHPTWIINQQRGGKKGSLTYVQQGRETNLKQLFEQLWKEYKLSSVLVEGGKELLDSFLREGLHDEIYVFKGKKRLFKGLKAPQLPKHLQWHPKQSYHHGQFLDFIS